MPDTDSVALGEPLPLAVGVGLPLRAADGLPEVVEDAEKVGVWLAERVLDTDCEAVSARGHRRGEPSLHRNAPRSWVPTFGERMDWVVGNCGARTES